MPRKRKLINQIDQVAEKIVKLNNSQHNNAFVLNRECYDIECKQLAKNLLGKVLVRQIHGKLLKGRIVETECYLGGEDKASHSHNGRRTPGNEPMFMAPGTSYVYMTYGMYFCMNISSKGEGAAVLLRSLEPLEEIETMTEFRLSKRKSKGPQKALKITELCNGPSKLCMSLSIDKETCNKEDMCNSGKMWIEDDNFKNDFTIVETSRVGIQSAGEEWASKPLRFYIFGNPHVSIRDKKVEASLSIK